MKQILVVLLVLFGFVANAQLPSNTFYSRWFTGNTRAEWIKLDSPLVNPVLDTFYARYQGTQIVRIQGGDTAFWFYAGNRIWKRLGSFDSTSISNRINLKLNISDTIAAWLSQSTRLVDTMYRVNDSTIGYTIKGIPYTFQILGGSSGGGGSGTVTSVALSMPSAFSVSGSPVTTSGTLSVSGAGTTLQYIRGNGTLATTDTGMIPSFYLKVRGLLTGTSPITFNQTTGAIGINNANTTGTKGAASFTSAFSDNGSGLIDLADIVSNGSCTNCTVTFNAKGQATAFSSGVGPSGSTVDTIFRIPGIDSIYFTINTVQHGIKDSLGAVITASNGLMKVGDDIRIGDASGPGAPLIYDSYIDAGSFKLNISGNNSSNAVLSSANSGSGYGLEGTSSSVNGIGIHAMNTAGGIGLSAEVLAGKAAYLTAISGIPIFAVGQPSNANGNTIMAEFHRQTSGTAANGIAQSFDYWSQLSSGTNDTIARVAITATTATTGSQTGAYDIWLKNNGGALARKSRLKGDGQWIWDGYPALTAQTDTTTYKPVAIDASGNVVKMIGWSGTGGGGGTPSWNAVMGVGNTAYNTSAFLIRNDGSQLNIRLNQNDTGNTNAIASVDIEALGAKAVTRLQTCWQHETEVQFFLKLTQAPNNHIVIDSAKFWTIGTVSILDALSAYRKGFRIAAPYFGNMVPIAIDSNGNVGFRNISRPKGVVHIPGEGAGGVPPLVIDPNVTPVDANSGRIVNTGTFLQYTDNAGVVWNLNNQFGTLPNGTYTSPSLTFTANSSAGMSYNAITGHPVLSSNSSGAAISIANSNSSGISGIDFRDNSFNQIGVYWNYNDGSATRLGTTRAFQIEVGGFDQSNPKLKITTGGNVLINTTSDNGYKLQVNGAISTVTDSSSSPINIAWIDTDGKIRKAATPAGATNIYNGDGTLSADRNVGSGGFTLRISGANNSDTLVSIINTGTTSTGLYVSGTALGINAFSSSGAGLQAIGSTRGAVITGDTDEGLLVKSNSVRGARIQTVPSSTNTVVEVLQLERGVSGGSGATGIGEYISFLNKTSTNSSDISNTIISKFTDGTTATRTSQFVITGVNSASSTNVLTLDGDGTITTIGKRVMAVTTSSAGTLTIGNSESYVFNGTTTTWTLPAVSGTAGTIYYLKNIGSGSITLNANAGANEIYSTSAVNTVTITAGSALILISNGTYFTTNP